MEMTNILKKLSVKEMNINPGNLIAGMELGQVVVVARIYGKATKYKTSPSRFTTSDLPKEDVKFFGDFEGVNLLTGEVFNAPACFLPGAAPDALQSAIDNMQDGDTAVEFGIEIGVKKIKKKDDTDGYQFGVALPKQPSASDPLSAMREKMASLPGAPDKKLIALAAPEKAAETETKKAKK